MSRSYKRFPASFEHDGFRSKKAAKRLANKKVRSKKGLFIGNTYKKLLDRVTIKGWPVRYDGTDEEYKGFIK